MFFGGNTAARRARRPGADRRRSLVLGTAAVTGTGLVALGGVAWTSPVVVPVTRPMPLHQQVSMTYAAPAHRGVAYPTGTLRTGDPVFLRLVPRVKVRVAYRAVPDVGGPITSDLHGTRRVTAELRAANGWHRGFQLQPRKAFTGAGFTTTATLDLARVRRLIAGMTRSTGIANQTYTLSIRNEIALSGSLFDPIGPTDGYGNRPRTQLRQTFFPELTFRYDGRQLQLLGSAAAGPAGQRSEVAAITRTNTPVVRDQILPVRIAGTDHGQLDVLGLTLSVRRLRHVGLVASLVLLLIAALGQRSRRRARRRSSERAVRRIVLDETPMDENPAPPRIRPDEKPKRAQLDEQPTRIRTDEKTTSARSRVDDKTAPSRARSDGQAAPTRSQTDENTTTTRARVDEKPPLVRSRSNEKVTLTRSRVGEKTGTPRARTDETTSQTRTRVDENAAPARVPGPRTAAMAQRQWARTHPTAHQRG